MMDRRQRKRLYIFLLVPILATILFLSNDLVIRIITVSVLVIYVAFIIFLRDKASYTADNNPEDEIEPEEFSVSNSKPQTDHDESFQIVSRNKNLEVITAENYSPEFHSPRTTIVPPDLKERFEEIANEALPANLGHDGQFAFVLEKILIVIKEAFAANTAIFFWYNKKKEKLSVEKYISNSTDITKQKIDVQDDILSKIVQKGEPELLNEISPVAEMDVIRYYTAAQGIRSFVGVPLFYDKQLIAIIAVDSKAADVFGIETIYSLGRFVRVLTMIISLFEEKHSESVSQHRLKGVLSLINPDKVFAEEEDVITAVQNAVQQLIFYDAFAFVYYRPLEQKFKTIKVINNTSLKYIGHNLDVELNGTLVGKSIVTGMPVKIDDTSASTFKRFSKVEDVSFDGSFIAVPLIYNEQNYGVLCFESLKKNAYTNSDIQFLKSSVNILSFILYSFSTQALLKSYLAVDIETQTLNEETFKERLSSDLIKAEQTKVPGAVALIRIDDFLEQESLFDGNPFPKVLMAVSETISKEMTPLNLFGRFGDKLFAVYFFNMTTKDVFIWAEKLRVKIARKPIAVVSKQTTYTVSIGVASASNKIDVDEIIYNANLALQKAVEQGGNKVRNIN